MSDFINIYMILIHRLYKSYDLQKKFLRLSMQAAKYDFSRIYILLIPLPFRNNRNRHFSKGESENRRCAVISKLVVFIRLIQNNYFTL